MEKQDNSIVHRKEGLTVSMMGNILVEYNGAAINYMGGISGKALHLFLILLYAGDRGIAREELLDVLYGSGDCENPGGNLRATVFRLRRLLEKNGLSPHDYIRTANNMYFWNPGELTVYIDVKDFQGTAKEALARKDVGLLKKACMLYKGDFLVQLSGERWVSVVSVYCQKLYFQCLRMADKELKREMEYGELLKLCSAACRLFPYEEWHIMKIDCLIAMKRYKEAMHAYDQAVTQYFEEPGLPPSEKMLERFRSMSGQIHYTSDTLKDVVVSLKEREKINGPYYCSYPAFIDCCRLIGRMVERIDFTSSLICFTLLDSRGKALEGEDELLKAASERLHRAIASSVRKGDLFTCCSPGQYLVMLNGAPQEYVQRIYERIDRSLHRWDNGRKVKLDFQVLTDCLSALHE